ncbi:MAG: septal ring lytic transglycosylase RlpA family protein [Candidatus Gracilibacteria bacterium]
MNKKLAKLLLISCLILVLPHAAKANEGDGDLANEAALISDFSDVTEGNSHYVAIQALKEKGIISGYEDGTFKPKKEITRTEALKIIGLATGKVTQEELDNVVLPEEPLFTDVENNAWYINYLFIAKNKNIINGYPDGSFKPTDQINLTETLKIYLECLDDINYPDPSTLNFADANPEGWYAKYLAYAASQEVLDITIKNEVFPDKKMTRGDFVEIVYRLKNSYENNYRFGKATFYGKAVQGHGTASGETFDMDSFTAAHKTLPFGTIIEVKNLSNGKTVEVKINDRGPFGAGRVIDLSSAAFEQLAPLGTGIITVQYRPVDSI